MHSHAVVFVNLRQSVMLLSEFFRVDRSLESRRFPVEVFDLFTRASHNDISQSVNLGADAPVSPKIFHIINNTCFQRKPSFTGKGVDVSHLFIHN